MKRLVLPAVVCLLLFCSACQTTPPPLPTPYQHVYDASGTQASVFARTVAWVSKNLPTWKGNLLRQDEAAGILTADLFVPKKYTGMVVLGDRRTLDCYAKFEVKENRVRVTFDNFVVVTSVREYGQDKDIRNVLAAGQGADQTKGEFLDPWLAEYQKLIAVAEGEQPEAQKPEPAF